MSRSARSIVVVVVTAAATVAALDLALQRVCPLLPQVVEVDDGVAEYAAGDPDTLVLGSSHARSFAAVRDELARRSNGRRRLNLVAVEWGKLSSYDWVVQHRLRPLIEEKDAQGRLKRPSLSRLILVTEWWDGCAPENGVSPNLPAKAWTFGDFLADVADHGVNEHNRNYVLRYWKRLLSGSILVQDRGLWRARRALRDVALGHDPAVAQAEFDRQVSWWHRMIESAYADPKCTDPGERAALRDIVGYFESRGVEVTVLLFPRMPVTLTPLARETTLRRYAGEMRALSAQLGFRLIDMTTSAPLADGDFMSDFDHVSLEGNEKFAAWALAGDLRDLLEPRNPPTAEVSP